ncbi:MAG: hypothetical protein LBK42_10410 [Propionibacteriaceae bacterium]|nr:hypothetical protein [Propionibacteriaceae bacterium]
MKHESTNTTREVPDLAVPDWIAAGWVEVPEPAAAQGRDQDEPESVTGEAVA